MRDNIKSIGLILAIVIAGVSLPTSIFSIMSKPTSHITEINNYYYNNTVIETYNNTIIERFNNTIIIWVNNTVVVNETIEDNELIPDRSKPIEEHIFTSTSASPYYILNYTMGSNEIYFTDSIAYTPRAQQYPNFHIVQTDWLELYMDDPEGVSIGEFYTISYHGYWIPPFLANWTVIAQSQQSYFANNWEWIFYDQIITIGA